LFAALFPSDCRICGDPLTNISRLPVCLACLEKIVPISVATCTVCGERLSEALSRPHQSELQICASCRQAQPEFTRAVACGAYEAELRELIHLLKYDQVMPAAKFLGRMLAHAIRKLDVPAGPVLVIPVPLHRTKRRQRGFNQAELIARAALLNRVLPKARIMNNILQRTRPTVSQIALTRAQRAENIRGAFRVKHLNQVAGRNVLLVDDVLTTGTTANECARILKKAGAANVWVATVARTLKDSGQKIETDMRFQETALPKIAIATAS
jgi:ComF family protein